MFGMTRGLGVAVLVTVLGTTTTRAEDKAAQGAHGGMGSSEMHEHMKKAGREMQSMKMSGDVDRDFVMAMRKHHQDGIAMAKMVLEHGKDPKTREMAQRIMSEQQKDLQEFDAWLGERGGDQPKPKPRVQGRTGGAQ